MSQLFTPFSVGTLEIPNRFVRSATAERLCDQSGRPRDALIDMYRNLVRGGVGLIITGHVYVHSGGRCHHEMGGLDKDDLIADWTKVVDAVHELGGKIAIQINHGGRQCAVDAIDGPMIAPSPVPVNKDQERPQEMSERDIREIIRAYALAAARAQAAGFDAVQLHSAHGYLIHCFNSPASNWRRDAWGGSMSHRLHFLEAVADAVRGEVGNDYPLFIKLGTVDFCRDGLTEKDGIEIIKHLREMGLDGVEISGGIGAGNSVAGIRSEEDEAYFLPIARKARYVTDLPIMLVGGMRSQIVMERILDEGSADFISLCRPFIREPDLPNRLHDGQNGATCISCNRCWPKTPGTGIACGYEKDA